MSTNGLRGIHVSSGGHLNSAAIIINIPISLLLLLIIKVILFRFGLRFRCVWFCLKQQDVLIVELMVLQPLPQVLGQWE